MKKATDRDTTAGCYQCSEGNPLWYGKKAVSIAHRHAKEKDHSTWVEVVKSVVYNPGAEFRKGAHASQESQPPLPSDHNKESHDHKE